MADLNALLAWYQTGGMCILEKPIEITGAVTLPGDRPSLIGAVAHPIRVLAGGQLTLDNPNLEVVGPEALIFAESGGTLILERGRLGGNPEKAVVVLRAGGVLKQSDHVQMMGFIQEDVPSDPKPEPEPTGIYSIADLRDWYARPAGEDRTAACELYANLAVEGGI